MKSFAFALRTMPPFVPTLLATRICDRSFENKQLKSSIRHAENSTHAWSFFPLKRDGILCVGWEKLALAVPNQDRGCEIEFNAKVLAKHNIDKEKFRSKFDQLWTSSPASASSVQWSV